MRLKHLPDVELFLKRQSVEFAKKHQAVTYETETSYGAYCGNI